jgi:transposase
MKKKLFIGIDFSKKTFDVSVIAENHPESVSYRRFDNSKEGCSQLLSWVKEQQKCSKEEWLFCGEHTGLYSLQVSEFLIKKGLFIRLENPLQIKLSTGIKRDKNDRVDSRDIALYAFRHQDRARCYRLPEAGLKSLELLLSFRDRLLQNKHSLLVSSKEIRSVIQRDRTARYIYEQSKKDIERINREIKEIEAKMMELIKSSDSMNENCKPVTSIKGVALINTVAIPVATQNFTRFENSRQFACYAGMAPFGSQSGTSIKVAPHVSHLADKRIKVLLTQAALCAIRHDTNIAHYCLRKKAEGKKDGVIVNNIRNKLIHRIFALVKSRNFYQVDYKNQPDKKALKY